MEITVGDDKISNISIYLDTIITIDYRINLKNRV